MLIERNAAFAPDKPAIHFEGATLSYAVLNARIEQTASALKSAFGVNRGDRVAILSLNRPDYLVLLYACARLGALLVPLNWRLAVPEQFFILSDAGAKVLVLEQSFAAFLPVLEEKLPDTAVIGLDFVPPRGIAWSSLLTQARGERRIAQALAFEMNRGLVRRERRIAIDQTAEVHRHSSDSPGSYSASRPMRSRQSSAVQGSISEPQRLSR